MPKNKIVGRLGIWDPEEKHQQVLHHGHREQIANVINHFRGAKVPITLYHS